MTDRSCSLAAVRGSCPAIFPPASTASDAARSLPELLFDVAALLAQDRIPTDLHPIRLQLKNDHLDPKNYVDSFNMLD